MLHNLGVCKPILPGNASYEIYKESVSVSILNFNILKQYKCLIMKKLEY